MITKMAFIAHPTRDIEAMKKFYGEVLGLELSADYGDMWCEFKTPRGETVALDTMSPKQSPSPSVYMALETDDIAAEVERLKEAGANVVMDAWTNEHEGKEICKMAVLQDPEGNAIMLHEIAEWRASE